MSKKNYPYVPSPEDVPAPDLSDIYSEESENSNTKNSRKTTNLSTRNTKSLNNANISRTKLDTEFIDLNADGDDDESKAHENK